MFLTSEKFRKVVDILQASDKSFSKMAKLVSFIIIAYLLIILTEETLSREVPFTKCASPFGQLSSVDVTPCDSDPCVFESGTNETIAVTFTPNEVVSKGDIHLYVSKWGIRKKLPLKNPHLCEGYGLKCPLKKDLPVKLSITGQIPQGAPSGTYEVEAELVDQNGGTVVCGIITVEIA